MRFRAIFKISLPVFVFSAILLNHHLDVVKRLKKHIQWINNSTPVLNTSFSGQAQEKAYVSEILKNIKKLDKHFMVIPDYNNHLGNDMFHFAASVGIARALKYEVALMPLNPLIKYFYIPKVHVIDHEIVNILSVPEKLWRNETWRQNTQYLSYNLTLHGYYQAWTYFFNGFHELRKMFTIRRKYLAKALAFLNQNIPTNKTIIGIHVRRKNFMTPRALSHGRMAASTTFFETAMPYFRDRYPDSFFVVVSDNIKWCRRKLIGDDIIYSDFHLPIIDMAIMSMCDHIIISAGTFGWWGAWLSKGTVVYLHDYPKPGTEIDTYLVRKDYYLPNWIGISNNGFIFDY